MEIESAIRIIENTVGFDDETTGVGEAWKLVLRYINEANLRTVVQEAVSAREADIWADIDDACNDILVSHGNDTQAGWGARAIRDNMRYLKPKEVSRE